MDTASPEIAVGLAFVLFWLFIGLISLAGFVLWIWALIDAVNREPDANNQKLVWVLIIVLTGWIGALIYLIVRRTQRIRDLGA